MAASERLEVRLTAEELAGIDRVCGSSPRGAWVKAVCRQAVRARLEFGRACVLRVKAYETQAEADADA